MKCDIVVATKNSRTTIHECLASFANDRVNVGRIVVVDSWSKDGTPEIAKSLGALVVQNDGRGTVAAYDIGWRLCDSELVMFIDSDAYIGKGTLAQIIRSFETNPRLGILGVESRTIVKNRIGRVLHESSEYYSNIIFREETGRVQKLLRLVNLSGRDRVTITGPCYVIRASAIQRIGGFIAGTDELFISRSILSAGFEGKWLRTGFVYHYPPSGLKSLVKQRYRNGAIQSYIFSKFYPRKILLIYLIKLVGAPAMALPQAIYYRNPWQLVIYPIMALAQMVGYFSRLVKPSTGANIQK